MVIVFEPKEVTHNNARNDYRSVTHTFNPDECLLCEIMMRIITDEWEVMENGQAKAHGLN